MGLGLNPILSDLKDYAVSQNLSGTTKSRDTIPIIVHMHSAFQIVKHEAVFFLLCSIASPGACVMSVQYSKPNG